VGDGGSQPDGYVPPVDPRFDVFNEQACLTFEEQQFGLPADATLALGLDSASGFLVKEPNTPRARIEASELSVGNLCGRAADVSQCKANLFDRANVQGWGEGGFSPEFDLRQVRTTSRDEVRVISTKERVKDVFLPVDRAKEAMAVAITRYQVSRCSKANVRRQPDGSFWVLLEVSDCDWSRGMPYDDEVIVQVTMEGVVSELARRRVGTGQQSSCAVAGRRPEGLQAVDAHASCTDVRGRYLATQAHLEAASVLAFERMVEELRALGAPASLVEQAESAVAEERSHAEVMGALSRRYGAEVMPVHAARIAPRSLLAMARENYVEGCVRETYGALLAHHQATHAQDIGVRAAMGVIRHDETRHAALSWDLHVWLMSQLSEAERAEVESLGAEALLTLRAECGAMSPDAALGLPSAATALRLLEGMTSGLSLAA
jgi:hypothetical protein